MSVTLRASVKRGISGVFPLMRYNSCVIVAKFFCFCLISNSVSSRNSGVHGALGETGSEETYVGVDTCVVANVGSGTVIESFLMVSSCAARDEFDEAHMTSVKIKKNAPSILKMRSSGLPL